MVTTPTKKCREVFVTTQDILASEQEEPPKPENTSNEVATTPNTQEKESSTTPASETSSPGKELVQNSRQIWSKFHFKA